MVRRLHLDELGPGAGIAEDDWYETERLTGHITGRARSTSAADEPAVAPEATLVLDWRHPDPTADAGAARGYDGVSIVDAGRRSPCASRARTLAAATPPRRRCGGSSRGRAHQVQPVDRDRDVGDRDDAAPPLLGFRRDPERASEGRTRARREDSRAGSASGMGKGSKHHGGNTGGGSDGDDRDRCSAWRLTREAATRRGCCRQLSARSKPRGSGEHAHRCYWPR